MSNSKRFEIVSSEDELLILVDDEDQQIGTLDKATCHDGDGKLHRAFSLFVFNSEGETLIQQRHPDKRLWPSYWSNGCCSHPRDGETTETAVVRRAMEELGLAVTPRFLFKFCYRESFLDIGSEYEFCSVFVSQTTEEPKVNESEIADWRWIDPVDLDTGMTTEPESFTPWLKIEWTRIRSEYACEIRPSQL